MARPALKSPTPEIASTVLEVLKQICSEIPSHQIQPHSRLLGDLGIDSLKIAELSLLLEEELGGTYFVPDLLVGRDPYDVTVQDLIEFVSKKG